MTRPAVAVPSRPLPAAAPRPGRRTLLAALTALPWLGSGCTNLPAPAPEAAAGTLINDWSGRFAVTLSEPGPEVQTSYGSGRFLLHDSAGATELELLSPLGQTLATASLRAGRAELQTAEGQRYEADSAEALTERVFGWRLPVGDLPRWLRGRLAAPVPGPAAGTLSGVEHGWTIRLENWRASGPGRLDLDWPAEPVPGTRRINLKLIVDHAS